MGIFYKKYIPSEPPCCFSPYTFHSTYIFLTYLHLELVNEKLDCHIGPLGKQREEVE